MKNTLFHGDNLAVLRSLPSESVNLVYLDPPFKSDQNYNMLYKERDGTKAAAQIQAFSDTWTWDRHSAMALHSMLGQGGPVADAIDALHRTLHGSDMMAYLVMMAPRFVELHRVLKPTGSLYLHCDPTASHYLKMLLDAVFRPLNYVNEVIWKRQSSHNDSAQGAKHYGRIHDVILFYAKVRRSHKWHQPYVAYDESYVRDFYRHVESDSGRRYRLSDITAPGGASPEKRNPHYEFLGVTRYWRFSKDRMEQLYTEGRIVQTRPGAVPAQKRYLDEMKGMPVGSLWDDIKPVQAQAAERLGYPTQKPEALLERIIEASTDEDDTVLDPFCGCGTTIAAAQKLKRRWIGIDITHLAIEVIEQRLERLGLAEGKDYKIDRRYAPPTYPDVAKLAATQPHTFQGWALQQAGIEDFQLKPGPDRGIDGRKVFFDPAGSNERRDIIVSVKGGRRLSANVVRDLIGAVRRDRGHIGVLISLAEPTPAMRRDAADAPPYRSTDGRVYPGVQILTVRDLLAGKVVEYPLQLVLPVGRPAAQAEPPRRAQQGALLREEEVILTAPRPKMARASLRSARVPRQARRKAR
jgi:DNA modification methylase